MASLNELKKYLKYEFSDGGTTGADYLAFQRKYINYLRSMCKENGWELAKTSKGHYCMSAFIKDKHDKYVYLSISDVRYFKNEWYNHILVRAAANDTDYHGCGNNRADLENLAEKIQWLFDLQKRKEA